VPAATLTSRAPVRVLRSKRLLALAGDQRLVEQIRRGNEIAFEVAYERHGAGILGFCRHMLGSREEAEDAVQHTFAAAFRDLQRGGDRDIALKAWLYTIARNRCVSVLRARREQAAELHELPTDGLSEQVEQRAELRELLADVRELPEEQRAALLLAEAAGMSHAEVAQVLGCETGSVKGLVFRARSALIEMRDARETSCADIREQLATLRGGALRRNELRHHLRRCPGCSAYRDEVRRQRQMLAAALPVVPSFGLKSSVLSAAGVTGSAAAGGAAAAGAFGVASATVAKVAVVGALAGGTVVAGEVVVHQAAQHEAVEAAPAADRVGHGAGASSPAAERSARATGETGGVRGERISSERNHGQRGAERRDARSNGHGNAGSKSKEDKTEHTSSAGGRKLGQQKQAERAADGQRGVARGQDPAFKASPRGTPPQKPTSQSRPLASPRATPPTAAQPKAQAAPAPVLETAPEPIEAAPKPVPPGQSKK
jgi:RNA polymerase sigma factor (sigma-70 family)